MRKKALALLLTASLLTTGLYGCGSTGTRQGEAETSVDVTAAVMETAAEEDADTDYTTGNPWIDSNIESNVEIAGAVDIKDHFDLAVNGDWVKEHPIKDGEYQNSFAMSFDETLHTRLLKLMQDDTSEDSNAKLVHTLYNAFLDWDARDAAGTAPLKPYLREIEEIQDMSDLDAYFSKTDFTFSGLFNWGPVVNPRNASQNILEVSPSEYFLDDPADYEDLENMSDYTRQTYDCYKEMVETVLLKCDYTQEQIDKIYEDAIQLEKQIAENCYTNDELNLTDTVDTLGEQIYTEEALDKYHWFALLKKSATAYGLEEIPGVLLYEKMDYFEHLDEILDESNLTLIKNYLLAHTASSAIVLLDKESYYKALDIRNVLLGSTGYKDENEYAVNTVSSLLEWPLSKLYCDQYVTEEDKKNVRDLIEKILTGYQEMLKKEDFLSDATKEKAIEKLNKMQINCMYPDDWRLYSYDDLVLPDNYFDAAIEIGQYEAKKSIDTFYDPVDKRKWEGFTPITQNAFYNPQCNSINILPGLIGDIFYNSEMPKEEVYGKLGAVIGHEISHAFDPNGAAYDADGNRNNWWTEEDRQKFKEKTDRMVSYYDGITVWDGVACSGEQCKGEACADMGGVAVMLHLAADDPDFDYAAFFKAFARSWALNATPESIYYIVNYDEHPTDFLRVNATVAQFDEFYEAFDVHEGDGMYIAPADRVKIW